MTDHDPAWDTDPKLEGGKGLHFVAGEVIKVFKGLLNGQNVQNESQPEASTGFMLGKGLSNKQLTNGL